MADKDPLSIVGTNVADKYVVEKLVGEGGFAVVYRAQHKIWNKPVAIKFFSELSSAPVDQRDELQQSFIQEGALLTELSSHTAGIVQARDVGSFTTPDGRWMPYMVLEWLEGESLEDVLIREQEAGAAAWSLQQMIGIIAQAGRALDVAHQRGIAHRDIKPANIFVLGGDPRGPKPTVKILDFGVAKMITDNTHMKAALAKTGTNITSFTPQYGAPEQFSRSYGATGPWTDVFALALVAVEMLQGRPALDGEDLIQLAYSSSNPEKRPTPRGLGLQVPDSVEAVFQKALAMQPTARFARAGELVDALEAAIGTAPQESREKSLASTVVDPNMGNARTVAATDPSLAAASALITTQAPATLGQPPPAAPAPKSRVPLIVGGVVGIGAIGAAIALFASGGGANETPPPPSAEPATASAAPSASAAPAAAASDCPDDMVKIPAGQFYMGSDQPDAPEREKPAHNVKLNAFCIDLHEVTRKDYVACSDKGACPRAGRVADWPGITGADRKAYTPLCNGEAVDRDDHPINCVTWRDANAYCQRAGKRLPTEAEWEFSTRGPDGRIYPWGDDDPTPQHLNACDKDCVEWAKAAGVETTVLFEAESDGFASTAPVGKYPAGKSRFGPFDVVGNVWEWVADYHGDYTAGDQENPKGPPTGDQRVIRGGGWNGGMKTWLRPSFRHGSDPNVRSPAIGFRCAKSID